MGAHAVADRTHFREVLAAVAEKARAKLPQAVNGRLESAVKLVLLDDVTPQADGRIVVGSCSDTMKTYTLEGDTCTCEDWQHGKAPGGWCKHRIAAGLHKRLQQVLAAEAPQALPQSTPVETGPLPEAPASVNVRVLVAGHEVQWTLRGTDEAEVFARLQALLARKDVRPLPPKPAPRTQGQWKKREYAGR
jgi:hypothetical protein